MATQYDLRFVQGDDPDLQLIVARAGVPVDIAGRRIELLVKPSRQSDDLDAVFQLSSTTGGIIITDEANGVTTVPLADRLEVAGHFWYRAWVADLPDPALNRSTFLFGRWDVDPS